MPSNLKIFVLLGALCALAVCAEENVSTTERPFTRQGVCPPVVVLEEQPECADNSSRCSSDSDCGDDMKCCNQGCGNVCTYPSYTGCQQLNSLLSRQASRSSGAKHIHVPRCRDDGKFEDIQCDEYAEKCWCVDDLGFELAGTRANSSDLVNCSAPKPCADVLCRMLCPYGFQLDSEGCPVCRCRNPCEEIECPAGQECQLEEVPCVEEVCPPLPTCRQPRRLEDLCPMGTPLSSPDNGNPFLCGVQPNKPQCPPNYICDVMPGNDYGVCCPLVDKPGQCPKELHAGETCVTCTGDMDCTGVSKCCVIEGCGLTCTKPANTTLCLQQKAVVELLLSGNGGYEGYVPQCLENGEFSPKQCSANGHLCWCVMENGTIISGTMGPKGSVECKHEIKPQHEVEFIEGRTTADDNYYFGCEKLECSFHCENGYKYDGKGCKTCECAEPCKDVSCPEGLECIVVRTDNCFDDSCVPIATCRDMSAHCNWGRALHTNGTGPVVTCKENECPETHFCEMKSERSGICCPKQIEIEHTKDSECPDTIYEPDQCSFVCHSDSECEGELKCCQSKVCGAVCFPPKPPKLPTMCEYIRDSGVTVETAGGNATLAIPVPQCLPDGPYAPMQCEESGECWCVDEFGVEIFSTRSRSRELDCLKVRDEKPCLGLICRLGCDFGFVMDEEGCPLCHCRNPCQNVSCGPDKTCQFLEVACSDDWCPPLPYCVPLETSVRTLPECPAGNPMLYDYDDDPVLCDPFSEYPQCPPTHECTVSSPRDIGVCCPKVDETTEVEADIEKKGQCPYLIPVEAESCDYECSDDSDCNDSKKCCSNGCGTQCLEPVLKTACQHLKSSAEHRAIELGIPASHMFIPNCTNDGDFSSIQCDPVDKTCWCVDRSGNEVPGTRESAKTKTDCTPVTDNCTPLYCDMSCPSGFETDKYGCPICDCKDPCKGIICKSPEETCRLVTVNCVSEPCPPIPLCLPKIENPCPIGEPLKNERFGDLVQCGPHGEQCPSSHRCHLSPLHEYAVCCPKPIISTCESLKKRNQQLRKATNRITFLPKCNRKTGAWDPTQCMESLGLCWCVDSDGNQLPGTLIRGVPHCTARSGKSLEDTPICPNGKEVHVCPEDLCQGKVCLAYPNATCNIDPCGGCKIQFLDDFNSPVDCNHGLTACFAEVQKVINSGVLKTRKFIDDDILPELEEVIEEFSVPPPAYPPPPPPPHFLKRHARQAVFDYEQGTQPLAMYDYDMPTYEESDIQELHIPTPKVMMVPRVHTIHIKIGPPQIAPQMPHMEPRVSSVFEPIFAQSLQDLVGMHPHVEVVGSAQRFTIMDDGDTSFMVKTGACPVPSLLSILRSVSEGCRDQCYSDFECSGNLKCCLYSCGLSCMPPVFATPRTPKARSGDNECPSVPAEIINPFACLFAKGMCTSDRDCSGNQKCCPTNCGTQCVKISRKKKIVENVSPVYLQAAAPRCSIEGGYAITQKQGELSWCVDQYGNPLHSTLTRGAVECNSNGTVVSRTVKGPVCSDSKKVPVVCKDSCLEAVCPQHPEAICTADPCNECAVKFVSPDGSPVSCEEKCSQPLVVGNCRSSLPRYFFNQTSKKCESFSYGGCQGNDNNFEELESCIEECEQKVPQCEQPKEVGLCRAQIYRWYYNKNTHQCEQFIYGGCSGNDNNFETKEKCERTCPDIVICPWLNVDGKDVKTCSRATACMNATCPGKDDAICSVDPCTCEPSFVDSDGKAVECKAEEPVPEESTAFLRRTPLSSTTRCQSLLKWNLVLGDTTYLPQCDEHGQFHPTQCSRGKEQQCWCVDEAGMQLPGTNVFEKGTKPCKFVKIKKIEVTLSFRHHDSAYVQMMKPAIKRVIEQFLKDLQAESTEVTVNVLPHNTHVMFTLLGDRKVQVAYMLEEMMRMGKVFIVLPKSEMPGDYRGSYFYHEVDYTNENVDNSIAANRIDSASSSGGDYNWTFFAIFLAVGCIILFILFYVVPAVLRKRSKEEEEEVDEKEKPSLISMVVHNVTYGITGKKPGKKSEENQEPKVVIQTVEAEYESIQKKAESDQSSTSSEAPPAYEDVKSKQHTEAVEKH